MAVLAAGPPAQGPDDLVGSRKERSRYDGLVRRQKKLAAAEEPQQPRRSERLEKKMLFVSERSGCRRSTRRSLASKLERG